MKKSVCMKSLCAVLAVCALLCAFVWTGGGITARAAGNTVLYSAQKTELTILVPGRANDAEKEAARLLADYIKQITGYDAPVAEAGTENYLDEYYAAGNKGAFIVLQQLKNPGDTPYGSFILRSGKNRDESPSEDKNLYIEAYDARGLYNGVYAYLRSFCGVNLYSADVKTVPAADTITVPDPYYLFYKPALEYADTDWLSPHDRDFAVANGLNGTYSPIEPLYGGKVKYITFAHSLTSSIVPAEELFDSNPEYFALPAGEKNRTKDQLCLSNPAVVNRAIEDALRLISENYDPDACLNILSVTQADNQNYCTCENCSAVAERYGGQSGLMLWFVNQIAEAVSASEHSDVLVDTFAYQYTRKAPTGIAPRDNVCVRLCSIECCFAHPLEDAECEKNAAFISDLKDWSKICHRLYIWDYTTNYSQTIGLFPDFGVLQANIDTFVKNNVVGIYEEGAYYAGECNTEFADLRAYLLARYLYDPLNAYGTAENIRDGFLAAYYGEGAGEIGEFLDYITAHAGDEEGHLTIGQPMKNTLHGVTKNDVKTLNALWDTAIEKTKAAGNDAAAARIERSRVSWEYYKACAGVGEYKRGLLFSRWIGANSKLIDTLTALGVTRYNEGRTMEQVYPSALVSPDRWTEGGVTVYIASATAALLILLMAAGLTLLAIRRKEKSLLLADVLICALIPLAIFSRALYIEWERFGLYALTLLFINLLTALFAPLTAYALNGFRRLTMKKTLISAGIGLAAAFVPFEILLVLMNNIIMDGKNPGLACVEAYFWFEFVILANLAVILVKLIAKKKTPQDQ